MLAALQTFPASYRWPVAYRLAQAQIGNAVPPVLAAAVAVSLGAQCFDRHIWDMRWDQAQKRDADVLRRTAASGTTSSMSVCRISSSVLAFETLRAT